MPACSTESTLERRAVSSRPVIPSSSLLAGSRVPASPTLSASCTSSSAQFPQLSLDAYRRLFCYLPLVEALLDLKESLTLIVFMYFGFVFASTPGQSPINSVLLFVGGDRHSLFIP